MLYNIWGNPKMGVPKNSWFIIYNGQILLKLMIWGYLHFRKPPILPLYIKTYIIHLN